MIESKIKRLFPIPVLLITLLIIVSLSTSYIGSTDVGDYAGVAKFFSGKSNADLRTSHSLVYGLIHAPLLTIFDSFFVMKITSLFWLILLIISVYHISGRNKKTLYLMLISPIVWYMGPWINPLQLASLIFLWGFHFINKYETANNKKYLILSGLLIGLSATIWNTLLFVTLFLVICFFYNRNINHFVIFIISFIAGLVPLLIIDQIFYGFALNSLLKFIVGIAVIILDGGIYGGTAQTTNPIINYLTFLAILPFFTYKLFFKKLFSKHKRQIIFITLLLLFFMSNPQIRYLILIVPLLIIYLAPSLSDKEFKIQILIFTIISLIAIAPYLVQIKYSTNSDELNSFFQNIGADKIEKLKQDSYNEALKAILEETGKQTFVIGNSPDDYYTLSHYYWGDEVEEFVSIQDYNLWIDNETILYKKKLEINPKINDRRKIWFEGGISKSNADDTDYSKIKYAIGIDQEISLQEFGFIGKYGNLYLSKKL